MIGEASGQDEPFFAYLSYYNVHTPIQPYKKRVGEYKEKLKSLTGQTPVIKEQPMPVVAVAEHFWVLTPDDFEIGQRWASGIHIDLPPANRSASGAVGS